MSRLTEIDELIKKSGKDGVRLLVLFKLLKSKVKNSLQQRYPNLVYSEEDLDRACITRAYELLRLEKDEPTEKDIEELLSRLNL